MPATNSSDSAFSYDWFSLEQMGHMYRAAVGMVPPRADVATKLSEAMHARRLSRPDLPANMAPAREKGHARYLLGLLDRHAPHAGSY